MGPIALHLGPLSIRWYGILIVLGVMLAAYVGSREARRRGENPEHVWNMLLLVLVFGIAGARLYHVFSSPEGGSLGWEYYRQNPLAILQVWKGGLAMYGAVAGGVLGLWLYTRWNRLPFLRWLDIGIPGVLLAQAVGRWGNFFNQELYGPPTNLPWGIYIAPANRLPGLEGFSKFHPVFLYESIYCLIGFVLIVYLARRIGPLLVEGDVFLMYLIYYPAGRFFIEFMRPDAWRFGGIAAAQAFALVAVAFGAVGIFVRHRWLRPKPAAVPEEAPAEGSAADAVDDSGEAEPSDESTGTPHIEEGTSSEGLSTQE